MKPKFSSFHGSQEIKDKYMARVKDHMVADEIIKGTGFDSEDNRGCAVGCTLHNYSHFAYEEELGIPFTIAILEDNIFESLSHENSKSFPLEFLDAVNVGSDLSFVYNKMQIFNLQILREKIKGDCNKKNCDYLISLHQKTIDGIKTEEHSWRKIYNRAYLSYLSYRAEKNREYFIKIIRETK